jgi:hypothetical protein
MAEILVEVRPAPGEPGYLAPKVFQPQLLKDRIDEPGESLVEIAEGLRQQLDQAFSSRSQVVQEGMGLEEVQMNFFLGLQGEAGVIISRVSTSAGFQVSLTWRAYR